MKIFLRSGIYAIYFCFLFLSNAYPQAQVQSGPSSAISTIPAEGLFDSDKLLVITISGNIRELLNDRSEKQQKHALVLTFNDEDGKQVSLPVEINTRGHFRKLKENCVYPPLLVHFLKNENAVSSVFKKETKLKLVMPCQGDEYVVREWLVYKLYNLVTPKSFRARLVQVKLEDTKNKKEYTPFYGVLLEDEHQMAGRNGLLSVKRKIRPRQAEPQSFLTMSVFEYLIGNTDWSVEFLQNIKLIATDSTTIPITVPYDFDHAGIVDPPYARPAEELEMNSVRERRYRGYCIQDMKQFDNVIALYNGLKKDIYALYDNCNLLSEKTKKTISRYFDEFYAVINNPDKFKKEFSYPCDKNGTGNVIIKGLRED